MSSFPRLFNHFATTCRRSTGLRKPAVRRRMRLLALTLGLLAIVPLLLFAATITVGGGAPTPQITFLFQNAFYRNGFSNLALLPPLGNVTSLGGGSAALMQVFETTAKNPNITMALMMPNQNAPASSTSVLQILPDIFGYYNTLGPATVGTPTTDTLTCSGAPAACTYQIFSGNYALFAYATPLVNGQTFFIKDPEFTKWLALGGTTGSLGYPIDISNKVTASTTTTGTEQPFSGGAYYTLTSGTNTGTNHAVVGPIYTTFKANLGINGSLGFPISDEVIVAGGVHQQTFEGGAIQYTPGSSPVVLLPVAAVRVLGPFNLTTTLQLNLNDSAQLTSQVFTASGAIVTGRVVTWSVTNTNVLSLTPNGATATIKAIGGGLASVTAIVNGVQSPALAVNVTAPCCQIGDGAPSTVQKAFLDALSRIQLKVATPLASPAQRVGNGYIQTMTPTGSSPVVVAEADNNPIAYVVSGAVLATWQSAGGASGAAGYPISDATPGNRQMFTGAAISGSPAYLVSGQLQAKWAAANYETGPLGQPTGATAPFTTALGVAGLQQSFQNGVLFGITSGPHHGETYIVSGLILARYTALGGPSGAYGAPLSDEASIGALRRQTFENGNIDYTPGDAVALDHPNPRTPAISSFPGSGVAGSRLALTVSGFANGATVKVTVGSQPDFTVTLPLGIFTWNYVVPSNATAGTIKLHAADLTSGATADGSFAIQSTASLGPKLTVIQGDSQSAGVSAMLPLPLQVAVRDASGNPLPGVLVTFTASPGAVLSASSVLTDSSGLASTKVRLPSSTGITIVNAQALGQFVSFGARATSTPPLSVPKMLAASTNLLGSGPAQIAQKGTLLTAAAMVLRYFQSNNQVASPNGTADPDVLNKYLTACGNGCDGYVTNPDTGEQVVNLWRLNGFTGGLTDISIESPDITTIQGLVAGGAPVVLNLSLTANGVSVGGSSVVATGVADDGSLIIDDPNPVLARTSLNDYLYGFPAANATWAGKITSAFRILVQRPPVTSFLVAAVSQATNGGGVALDVRSASGSCGPILEIPDAAPIGSTASAPVRASRFAYCNGSAPPYQISLTAPSPYRAFFEGGGLVKDLSGSSAAAYALNISASGQFSITGQTAAFTSDAVLNAATFLPGIAPGGLFSIFGAGLSGPSGDTTVKFGDKPSQLILKSPFQLNGQVPPDLDPGTYPVTVQSAWGSVSRNIVVNQAAPGIFVASTGNRTVGTVINQDGTLNDLNSPARRGDVLTIYCSNLGAVQAQGSLFVTVAPVTALLNGTELPVQYAGLTPGFIGLYQVNVPVPDGTAPGSNLSLSIKAGGVLSNAVNVAIQ